MIVDLEKNKQLSARDNRGIKLVRVFPLIKRDPSSADGGVLEVTFPDSPDTPSFAIPLSPTQEQLSTWETHAGFDLWGASLEGYVVESAAPDALETPSEILSTYVGRPVLLVMKTPTPRPIMEMMPLNPARLAYAGGSTVRYPDFSPFLLVSNASLDDAEAKVWAMARGTFEKVVAGCNPDDAEPPTNAWARADAKRLLMERFRPNVVVSGVEEAFGEDDWQEISTIHHRNFLLPARCPRCMFPNVDTENGKRDPKMPNNAMMQYRKVDAMIPSKYCFGMYMIPAEDSGVLSVGDQIFVTRSAVNPKLVVD
ncbi:MOSC domain-containing protein [Mycena rosella]|uniref:MOSC domain-containing protein n=1 Tax=Mycena rosella TaxID=1033263 RepID=A0AAD7DCN7_MYCRO|nr:MOSC domain-containing protein [Mycena rosella]